MTPAGLEAQHADAVSPVWLVPRARRALPVLPLLGAPVFGAVYLVLVMSNPVLGGAQLAALVLTLLAMLTFAYTLMSRNADILDPMRVVSFYFLVVFCLAPLAATGVTWHYTRPFHELMLGPTLYVLGAYLMTLVGYHFPLFPPIPPRIERRPDRTSSRLVSQLAILLFGVGFLSWVGIMVMTGGLEGLVYSDRARGEFFYGFGYLFWGAILMYPGATLYWAAALQRSRRIPWMQTWPLLITFACFLVLQGRMRAMNILILGIFVAHYLNRPIRPLRLGLFGLGGLSLALFIGVVRAPSTRAWALANPLVIIQDIVANFGETSRGFIMGDLSRLRQIVLIMDKVPDWMPYDWGRSLLISANPWLRLIGLDDLQTQGIGPRLFLLAHPDLSDMPTGYLPSILGEMIVNFPWFIAILVFVPFGMTLRWIYQALIVRRGGFVSVALYVVLLLQMANMLLQSLGHVVFELFLIAMPIVLIGSVSRVRR